MTIATTIPTVDLGRYNDRDPAERSAFVKQLGDALAEFGFAIVGNHGVSQELIDGTFGAFRDYFALPADAKAAYDLNTGGQRGHTSFGKERAVGAPVPDLKEFFHVGPERAPGQLYVDTSMEPNVWPSELPMMRIYAGSLYAQLEFVAARLLAAIGEYLKLRNPNRLSEGILGGESILRAIHYPPLADGVAPAALRAAAHEDINLITLLPEATEPGLELLARDGQWIPITALSGQLVVDAGDMLMRASNGIIPATTHRVVNPHGPNVARYSLPFFVHPRSRFDLTPMPECVSDDRPAAYPPITAGAYLHERLVQLGLR